MARDPDPDRVVYGVWFVISQRSPAAAQGRTSRANAEGASGSCRAGCDRDRRPRRTGTPHGPAARDLPAMRRARPCAGSEMDGEAVGGVCVLWLGAADEEGLIYQITTCKNTGLCCPVFLLFSGINFQLHVHLNKVQQVVEC